jgi:hypothetical protein
MNISATQGPISILKKDLELPNTVLYEVVWRLFSKIEFPALRYFATMPNVGSIIVPFIVVNIHDFQICWRL